MKILNYKNKSKRIGQLHLQKVKELVVNKKGKQLMISQLKLVKEQVSRDQAVVLMLRLKIKCNVY
jgi:hypothetical protein